MESKTSALSDLCEAIIDCPHSTPKWTARGVLVLRSHNIRAGRLALDDRSFTDEEHYKQRSRRAEIRAGDLVITREAPMGEVCMIPPNLRCCLGQRMVLLRPDPRKCDRCFLLYAMQSPSVQCQIGWSEGTGSTVSNLRIPHLEALRVPTPQLDEQRAIGAALGSLDDKIEHNRKTSRALEGLARAMFKAWFVDFEPVHAKAAGATSFPGMPAEAFAALPTRFTDSELGPVPEGWEPGRLGDLLDIHDSRRIPLSKKQREAKHGHVRYFGAAGVIDYVDEALFDGVHVLAGEDGSVVNADGTPVTQYVWGKFWVNNHAHVLTARLPWANEHLLLLLKSLQVKPFVTGAVQPKLSQGNMKSITVLIPQGEAITAFGRVIEPLYAAVRSAHDESAKLAELRDYLLPKLLSGEVRVREELDAAEACP
ncbi:MAG: restriction endonuclease subunit S [Planctomycetes bacterium]|nr:restriction endonuclease subunit S [Planctomycetota bacterium]